MNSTEYRCVIDVVYERTGQSLASVHAVGLARGEDLAQSPRAVVLAEGLCVLAAIACGRPEARLGAT